MCGAPAQTPTLPASVDLEKETVIYGAVTKDAAPVAGRVRPVARCEW